VDNVLPISVITSASNGNEIQLPKTEEEAIEIIQGK
jgi:hypothetical protein